MYSRTCTACGKPFETNVFRQKKCTKNCGHKGHHKARAYKREHNDITFVGVDGEGVDRPDGRHEYVMLSVGDETLWKGGRELALQEILSFLWEQYQRKPDAAFVGFFLGYDFIQWLKLLPFAEARLLFDAKAIHERKSQRTLRANPYPDAVVWEGWEIDIMAGRRFRMRPHVCHKSDWNAFCRNRTCGRTLEVEAPIEGPNVENDNLYGDGDMDLVTETWEGDDESFWNLFTRNKHTAGQGKVKVKVSGWMYICDTGPFWQTSFLNVINPDAWGDHPVTTQEEYATVKKGKADRGMVVPYGASDYYEEMRMYNTLENDILARVTARLNKGFMNERIPIKIPKTDWYGPGRAAQLWMDQLHSLCADPEAVSRNREIARNNSVLGNPRISRENETGLLNLDVYESMPTWFYEAAQASYYGGWFEQFIHGHVGDVWEYDINSAYPYIIASLPCLHTSGIHNGSYNQGEGKPDTDNQRNQITLVYGTIRGSNPYIGAMPYRTKKGLISRPHVTKGWYWQHEIEAAKRAGLIDTVETERWVSYQPCTCTPPFNPPSIGIESLYQLRLDFGKNTPQGKSAKLVYNSAYGKTAQSIGSPKYSNPVYASLITAGCRTLILEAIASHPGGAGCVSMVATDGVYFTERHPSLEIDPTRLGAWDESFKPNLTQLMPGVYWDDNGRGKLPKLKSRGVPAKDLAKEIEKLDGMFAVQHYRAERGEAYEWPEIVFKSAFLLESCKNAMNRGKWGEAGKVTHNKERRISSDPYTKRISTPYFDHEMGLVRTRPYDSFDTLESTAYDKSFGYLEEEQNMFGGMVSRNGDDGMSFWKDLINGQ